MCLNNILVCPSCLGYICMCCLCDGLLTLDLAPQVYTAARGRTLHGEQAAIVAGASR